MKETRDGHLINPYSVMVNDVEHLVQNKDYIDRYIMVIKILYEA